MNNPGVTNSEHHLTPPPESYSDESNPGTSQPSSPITDLPSNPIDALGVIAGGTKEITPESSDSFKGRLLNGYKGYTEAHEAVSNLLQGIPEPELRTLQETGQLQRILSYCPTQEFRNQSPLTLTRAYERGKRVLEKVPERWKDRTTHYLQEIPSQGLNINPGLKLTENLLTIASSKFGDYEQKVYGTIDSVGREALMNITERTRYAADIVSLARAVPANIHDMGSWTMQPNKELFYPTFLPSTEFDDTIPEIRRALEESPGGKIDLVQLQNSLSQQDGQFGGQDGLNRIQSIIGAMKIYEEVFAPPVQKTV